ncbi:DUF4238 domain-containing protein [Psychrobacter okhotskensis]|uniref:DUF4238 domain-containing protein n=1 Tax=Psychrobacter okhotskensis TaxID=212403 RepID=UPI003CFCAFB8
MELKRRHHFVSRFYLENWYEENSLIVLKNNKQYKRSSKSVAFKQDFYKIVPLKTQQIELFKSFAEKCNFTKLQAYKEVCLKIIETQDISQSISKVAQELDINLPIDLENMDQDISYNTFEDKFFNEEDKFSTVLSKIIEDVHPMITLNDYDMLLLFIAFQLVKTPKKIESIMKLDRQMDSHADLNFTQDEHRTFTIFMTQCYQEYFYRLWASKAYEITIYHNTSDIGFITSDDPCFDQKTHVQNEVLIQLPISPKFMIELSSNSLLNDDEKSSVLNSTYDNNYIDNTVVNNIFINFINYNEQDVLNLNSKIFNNKDVYIYAHSKKDIEALKINTRD